LLWAALSLLFFSCAWLEVRASIVPPAGYAWPRPVNTPYLVAVLALAALCAWPPLQQWRLERQLSAAATRLAEGRAATVHCNTLFDTLFDTEMLAGGHADPRDARIVLQPQGCAALRSYLRHPGRASDEEIWSLGLFTHESMHVLGSLDEVLTECQAVQRNYRAAKLLGVPDAIAQQNALDYYRRIYQPRRLRGPMQSQYYSPDCAPGKALDEQLADSTWQGLQPTSERHP
jgi:hypothetical protein